MAVAGCGREDNNTAATPSASGTGGATSIPATPVANDAESEARSSATSAKVELEVGRFIVTAASDRDVEELAVALEADFGERLHVDRILAITGQLVVSVAVSEEDRLAAFPGVARIQEDRAEPPTG